MRISDWSSDVCSSDLLPAFDGVDSNDASLLETDAGPDLIRPENDPAQSLDEPLSADAFDLPLLDVDESSAEADEGDNDTAADDSRASDIPFSEELDEIDLSQIGRAHV